MKLFVHRKHNKNGQFYFEMLISCCSFGSHLFNIIQADRFGKPIIRSNVLNYDIPIKYCPSCGNLIICEYKQNPIFSYKPNIIHDDFFVRKYLLLSGKVKVKRKRIHPQCPFHNGIIQDYIYGDLDEVIRRISREYKLCYNDAKILLYLCGANIKVLKKDISAFRNHKHKYRHLIDIRR